MCSNDQTQSRVPPEKELADMLRDDLGLSVSPQALRIFIRLRWERASRLVHRIHAGGDDG